MKKTRFSSPRYFKLSKKQNANEILEDYVEAIEEISKDKKDVKNIDLSKHFGVSNATVNKNIKRLIKAKLVTSEKYRSVHLTMNGKKLASDSNARHEIVFKFLRKIGVPKKIAEEDSEGMEHHISFQTLKVMKAFI